MAIQFNHTILYARDSHASAKFLADRRGALTTAFAVLIFAVAAYMLVRSLKLI